MSEALAVRDLSVASRNSTPVRDVSFALAPGDALTILGESGSGKSLLLAAIMATLAPELTASGIVTVGDASSSAASTARRALWGQTLALLPQEPWLALDPTMRVAQQISEGYPLSSRADRQASANAVLETLGLRGEGRRYPFEISGGMAQRVAFAAAEAGGAAIVMVDEPTKGLDAAVRDQLIALLQDLRRQGRTLVTVTHDVEVARAIGGTVMVMLDGKLIERGDAAHVLAAPSHDYTRGLIAAEPSRWPDLAQPEAMGHPILSATGLAKAFSAKRLFDGLDLDIPAGGRLAITGDSGSGKTTLGNILLGLAKADAGRVVRAPQLHAIRFQKLYQDPPAAFVPGLTLGRALNDLVSLHGIDRGAIAPLMERLKLSPVLLDRLPHQVSGGELQRLALARVLLLDPALIFADEPTSRLDPITQRATMELLATETAERGCALLLVTHDAAIARKVAGEHVLRL